MPAIKVTNQGDSANAISTLKFRMVPAGGALATLAASAVTATDKIGFSIVSKDYLLDANPNVESSADIVRSIEDVILDDEPVISGEAFVPVEVTTALNFLLRFLYNAPA